jgi:hypothetical protein
MIDPKGAIKKTGVNTFLIISDPDSEAHEVRLNGKCVYHGAAWDYHPGCWGGWTQKIGDFGCPGSLVNAIIVKYKIAKHKTVKKTMEFTESGKWKKI